MSVKSTPSAVSMYHIANPSALFNRVLAPSSALVANRSSYSALVVVVAVVVVVLVVLAGDGNVHITEPGGVVSTNDLDHVNVSILLVVVLVVV